MAGFTITSPTNRVVLDRRREGQAAFTVINQTGHQVRAQTYIVAVGTTDPRWLSVVGKAERNLLVDAAEPIFVEVAAPPDVPAGQYPFRLDVASVDVPNEEWGRGPVVIFECLEPEQPPEPEPETEPPGYIETVGGALLGALPAGMMAFNYYFVYYSTVYFFLALWFGPTIGAFLLLRLREFRDPWLTAVPMAVLMLLVGLPILWIGLNMGGILTFVGMLVGVSVPALAARAFARWRLVGHP
jgi:hypothetical protein